MKRLMAVLMVLGVLGAMSLSGCRADVAVDPKGAAPVTSPR